MIDEHKAAYVRSLSTARLEDFLLESMNRFQCAQRAARESRSALEEQREFMKFIQQVIREKQMGNVIEFPQAPEVLSTVSKPANRLRYRRK